VPEHRVQVNVPMCPRGATGRVSSVAVVISRQRSQVMVTVVTIPMVLRGPDAGRTISRCASHLRLGVVGVPRHRWLTAVPPAQRAAGLAAPDPASSSDPAW
jgi:hypothetical protein